MRRKVIRGIAAVCVAAAWQIVAPTEAFACHKGEPHGQQTEIEVGPIEVCGRLL